MPKGTLHIIATPIGNLSDITLRALETVKKVDFLLSEDTRETSKLLDRYEIKKPQISYRDQNHNKIMPLIEKELLDGKEIGLITDSGTPLVSDPGFKLVRDVQGKGFNISCIPGPSAVIASLVVSGLPTDKFVFLGFLPKGKNLRTDILKEYGILDATLVIYESPFRLIKLLEEVLKTLGDRKVCVVNDITKKFENIWTEKTSVHLEALKNKKPMGEYVVLIAKEGY